MSYLHVKACHAGHLTSEAAFDAADHPQHITTWFQCLYVGNISEFRHGARALAQYSLLHRAEVNLQCSLAAFTWQLQSLVDGIDLPTRHMFSTIVKYVRVGYVPSDQSIYYTAPAHYQLMHDSRGTMHVSACYLQSCFVCKHCSGAASGTQTTIAS